MRLQGVSYYHVEDNGVPEAGQRVVLSILAWLVGDEAEVVAPPPEDAEISVSVVRNGAHPTVVRSVGPFPVSETGFCSVSISVPWSPSWGLSVDNGLLVTLSSTYGEVRSALYRMPEYTGPWAAVFLENLKLGVLHMSGQTQSLTEIVNTITDKVRNALQVAPGETNRWCSDHNPTLAPDWGSAVSWGFSSVGFWIHNFGDVAIEFSFDGVDRHGIVPAGKAKVYDFRRETQVFFRASSVDPTITLEVW